jgi:hypothetical protein
MLRGGHGVSHSVQDELSSMRNILPLLEARLERGEVAPEGLPEFKSVVDDIRLRVWSLLSAAGSEEPRAVAERFRLRRAAEMCRALTTELSTGAVGAGYPEWPEVQQAAARLQATIAVHTGQAA